eukprot:753125-Hanusia_phi.AAC.2
MQCLLPDVTFEINGQEYTHEDAYFSSVRTSASRSRADLPPPGRGVHEGLAVPQAAQVARGGVAEAAQTRPIERLRECLAGTSPLVSVSPAGLDSCAQEISQSRVYVPQKQDVGRILKLECIPISQNGLYT